jgi:hypothetical protein
LERYLLEEDKSDPGDYSEWVEPLLSCWLFRNCKVLAVEYRLSDPIRRVAGCFDFMIETERGTTVLGDLKTVGSALAAKRRKPATAQLGAYRSMLAAHHPLLSVDRCVTVVAGPGCCVVKSSDVNDCIAAWDKAWERFSAEHELMHRPLSRPEVTSAPDWTAIFALRPDLDPPGYAETLIDIRKNPRERPARSKSRNKSKTTRWTSLKHASPEG